MFGASRDIGGWLQFSLRSRKNLNSSARGLTSKAFFYAGSRALLVSHWPVVSDAAVTLTTRMLALSGKGVFRAEAHRQAMMAMIDTGPVHNAHPALWAPFVVVGEGGIRHTR